MENYRSSESRDKLAYSMPSRDDNRRRQWIMRGAAINLHGGLTLIPDLIRNLLQNKPKHRDTKTRR